VQTLTGTWQFGFGDSTCDPTVMCVTTLRVPVLSHACPQAWRLAHVRLTPSPPATLQPVLWHRYTQHNHRSGRV